MPNANNDQIFKMSIKKKKEVKSKINKVEYFHPPSLYIVTYDGSLIFLLSYSDAFVWGSSSVNCITDISGGGCRAIDVGTQRESHESAKHLVSVVFNTKINAPHDFTVPTTTTVSGKWLYCIYVWEILTS